MTVSGIYRASILIVIVVGFNGARDSISFNSLIVPNQFVISRIRVDNCCLGVNLPFPALISLQTTYSIFIHYLVVMLFFCVAYLCISIESNFKSHCPGIV